MLDAVESTSLKPQIPHFEIGIPQSNVSLDVPRLQFQRRVQRLHRRAVLSVSDEREPQVEVGHE